MAGPQPGDLNDLIYRWARTVHDLEVIRGSGHTLMASIASTESACTDAETSGATEQSTRLRAVLGRLNSDFTQQRSRWSQLHTELQTLEEQLRSAGTDPEHLNQKLVLRAGKQDSTEFTRSARDQLRLNLLHRSAPATEWVRGRSAAVLGDAVGTGFADAPDLAPITAIVEDGAAPGSYRVSTDIDLALHDIAQRRRAGTDAEDPDLAARVREIVHAARSNPQLVPPRKLVRLERVASALLAGEPVELVEEVNGSPVVLSSIVDVVADEPTYQWWLSTRTPPARPTPTTSPHADDAAAEAADAASVVDDEQHLPAPLGQPRRRERLTGPIQNAQPHAVSPQPGPEVSDEVRRASILDHVAASVVTNPALTRSAVHQERTQSLSRAAAIAESLILGRLNAIQASQFGDTADDAQLQRVVSALLADPTRLSWLAREVAEQARRSLSRNSPQSQLVGELADSIAEAAGLGASAEAVQAVLDAAAPLHELTDDAQQSVVQQALETVHAATSQDFHEIGYVAFNPDTAGEPPEPESNPVVADAVAECGDTAASDAIRQEFLDGWWDAHDDAEQSTESPLDYDVDSLTEPAVDAVAGVDHDIAEEIPEIHGGPAHEITAPRPTAPVSNLPAVTADNEPPHNSSSVPRPLRLPQALTITWSQDLRGGHGFRHLAVDDEGQQYAFTIHDKSLPDGSRVILAQGRELHRTRDIRSGSTIHIQAPVVHAVEGDSAAARPQPPKSGAAIVVAAQRAQWDVLDEQARYAVDGLYQLRLAGSTADGGYEAQLYWELTDSGKYVYQRTRSRLQTPRGPVPGPSIGQITDLLESVTTVQSRPDVEPAAAEPVAANRGEATPELTSGETISTAAAPSDIIDHTDPRPEASSAASEPATAATDINPQQVDAQTGGQGTPTAAGHAYRESAASDTGFVHAHVWRPMLYPPPPLVPDDLDEARTVADRARSSGWSVAGRFLPGVRGGVAFELVISGQPAHQIEDIRLRWQRRGESWAFDDQQSSATPHRADLVTIGRLVGTQVPQVQETAAAVLDEVVTAALTAAPPRAAVEEAYTRYRDRAVEPITDAIGSTLEAIILDSQPRGAHPDPQRCAAAESVRDNHLARRALTAAIVDRAWIGADFTIADRAEIRCTVEDHAHTYAQQHLRFSDDEIVRYTTDHLDHLFPDLGRTQVWRAVKAEIVRRDEVLASTPAQRAARLAARTATAAGLREQAEALLIADDPQPARRLLAAAEHLAPRDPQARTLAQVIDDHYLVQAEPQRLWPNQMMLDRDAEYAEIPTTAGQLMYLMRGTRWTRERIDDPAHAEVIVLRHHDPDTGARHHLRLVWDASDDGIVYNSDASRGSVIKASVSSRSGRISLATVRRMILRAAGAPVPSTLPYRPTTGPSALSGDQRMLLWLISDHSAVWKLTEALADPGYATAQLFDGRSFGPVRPGVVEHRHPEWARQPLGYDIYGDNEGVLQLSSRREGKPASGTQALITITREQFEQFAETLASATRDALGHRDSVSAREDILRELLGINELLDAATDDTALALSPEHLHTTPIPSAGSQTQPSPAEPAPEVDASALPTVSDHYPLLYAAANHLIHATVSAGTYLIGPADGAATAVADHTAIEHLRRAGFLDVNPATRQVICSEAGARRRDALRRSHHSEPPVGAWVLDLGTGHAGVVCDLLALTETQQWAEVVVADHETHSGPVLTVEPADLTVLDRAPVTAAAAAELYRTATSAHDATAAVAPVSQRDSDQSAAATAASHREPPAANVGAAEAPISSTAAVVAGEEADAPAVAVLSEDQRLLLYVLHLNCAGHPTRSLAAALGTNSGNVTLRNLFSSSTHSVQFAGGAFPDIVNIRPAWRGVVFHCEGDKVRIVVPGATRRREDAVTISVTRPDLVRFAESLAPHIREQLANYRSLSDTELDEFLHDVLGIHHIQPTTHPWDEQELGTSPG
ncbi:hypothetical protein, partial [Nocardia asiatica]|uniref:hypothetical protein n=1 Tax=Nocardia asiatica TaxID=209252 RepID=UPI0012FA767D